MAKPIAKFSFMEQWKKYRISDLTIMKNGKKRPSGTGQFSVYGGNGIMDYADVYNAENTIVDFPDGITCKQLAADFGGEPNYYNNMSWQLAKRVQHVTNCPIIKRLENDGNKYWPILYIGKYTQNKKDGIFLECAKVFEGTSLRLSLLPYGENECFVQAVKNGCVIDESKKESSVGTIKGLELLNITSEFEKSDKIVKQSVGKISENLKGISLEIFKNILGEEVTGYEIHEGRTKVGNNALPLINVEKGLGNDDEMMVDGASEGNVFGTYFHGIFHNYNFRREFLNYLRSKKGFEVKNGSDPYETQKDYSLNRIAEIVEENLDMDIIDDLLFKRR